jgi:hypothetical protein
VFLYRRVGKKTLYENNSPHHCIFEKNKENNNFFSLKNLKHTSYSKFVHAKGI